MTYTVTSSSMAVVYNICGGFWIFLAQGALWSIPLSFLPREVVGASAGLINFGGQISGFCAPIIIGYLVQVSGGSFNPAFMFLMSGALAASLVALTLRGNVQLKKQTSQPA